MTLCFSPCFSSKLAAGDRTFFGAGVDFVLSLSFAEMISFTYPDSASLVLAPPASVSFLVPSWVKLWLTIDERSPQGNNGEIY